MSPPTIPVLERFLNQIAMEPNSGCWLWTGACVRGYAYISVGGQKSQRAHRFAYEAFKGPIPEGLQLDHLCAVKCCVNPDHLEPVTSKENIARCIPANSAKTHCPQGHPYDRFYRRGDRQRRSCSKCDNRRQNERRREMEKSK